MTSEQEPPRASAEIALEGPESPIECIHPGLLGEARPSRMAAIRCVTGRCLANWRSILLAGLVIVAVGLAALLFFFQYRPDRQIDDAAAQQAIQAASDGATAVLSYSSDSLDRDFANANSHLTGDFLAYYSKFTQEIVAPAVRGRHLTQKAAVIRVAVSELHPDSAALLVFLNETVTSNDKPQPLTTPSGVRISLTKLKGSWLIAKFDAVA